MGSIVSFLRNYEFLQLTAGVNQQQVDLYKKPNDTWGQVGDKVLQVAWNNARSCTYPIADAGVYGLVSFARWNGYLLPPLAVPELPRPQDNIEFLDYSVKRALWKWPEAQRKIIESEFDDELGDQYNIYQVLGEWAIAVYCENVQDTSFFTPTFLEASKPLADRTTVLSLGDRFVGLSEGDQREILLSIYNQRDAKLSGAAKQVHRDLRALASLLSQGNAGFIDALSKYFQQRSVTSAAPAPVAPRPAPSAPLASRVTANLTHDVDAFKDFVSGLSEKTKRQVLDAIKNDHDLPEESEAFFLLARLFVLLRSTSNPGLRGYPPSFPWNERTDGVTCRQAVMSIGQMSYEDRAQLMSAILDQTQFNRLGESLRRAFFVISHIAEKCRDTQQLKEAYKAYRTSLAQAR